MNKNNVTHRVVNHSPFTVEFISGNKTKRVTYPVWPSDKEIEFAYPHIDFNEEKPLAVIPCYTAMDKIVRRFSHA